MKRSWLILAAALAVGACGPAQVVVTAELQPEQAAQGVGTAAEAKPIGDLEVWLLPYDRDVIFDSLEAAASTPQPPIPDSLVQAQAKVAEAQQEWRGYESRWNALRDTLQKLDNEMKKYSRGEARYVALFKEFNDLDDQYSKVEANMKKAFSRFDSLSKATIGEAQKIKIARDQWANEAFANVDEAIAAKVAATGLKENADTTGAEGIARFEVKPGKYWVHARYEEPYQELYWNVPIDVTRGDPIQVTLTRENAQKRTKL